MKLAICAAGELFGGVEKQITDVCGYWKERGDPLPLVLLFHDGELASQLRSVGVPPVIIPSRNKYDFSMVGFLETELTEHGIDVLHVHGYKAMVACGMVKKKVDLKIVKTEHGKLEGAAGNPLSWVKSRVNFLLEQYYTRTGADAVCYVTDDLRRHLDRIHRGCHRFTVHNGIVPRPRPTSECPPEMLESRFRMGIVGRLSSVKGIPVALKAMAGLDDDIGAGLFIIGTGNLEDELRAEATSLGLGDRVQFLGFKSNIMDYIAHLDVLLMPSYHEGLPYSLLEAMSLGIPAIVSRVGGLAEVIQDGVDGMLVPSGDAVALQQGMDKLMRDRDLGARLGATACETLNARFTLAGMVREYERIYSAALDGTQMGTVQ